VHASNRTVSIVGERARPTFVAFLSTLAISCGYAPPAEDPVGEVRRLLDELVEAVEEHQPQLILSRVAFDFRSDDGLTYADVQSITLEYLIPEGTIGAQLQSVDVTPGDAPDEIRARTTVRFARGARLSDRNLPPPPDSVLYEFEILFRKIEGDWRAIRGRYERESG
jgi:hypothetical protein